MKFMNNTTTKHLNQNNMRYVFLGIVIIVLIAFVMSKKTKLSFGSSILVMYVISAVLYFVIFLVHVFIKFW